MVTKGIIKSIDYNGNTCKVRVPILESACDDAEIILSAIFATTPGIFNGYKEEDVVIVSFEDNNYENAIILGKLYLGASKESKDPRGTVSCANLKSENQATIPLSSKLVYDAKDKNTANVKGSYNDYKTLADIVDGLQTQKIEIGSINAQLIDTGDSIGARVSKLEEDSSRHEAELIVHADEIDAKVSKEHNDGTQKGLGWNLNEESWRINAYDEVSGKPDLKELNIVTIDRNGMTLNGDLKINGYPSEIVIKYARWAYPDNYPACYKGVGSKVSLDDYVGFYILKSGKYVLVAEYNKDKLGIIANETIAYEIDADSWLDNEPDRADGEYIWQWTRTFKYEWIDTGTLATSYWISSYEDKIVCITGATGSTGEPATIYWAKLSTAVHTGKNQKSDIEITPYAKTGSAQEIVDTTAYFNYSLDNGANWKWKNDDWMSVAKLQDNKIVILAKDIVADNIIIKLAHAYTDQNDSSKLIYSEYETETITYSPLNTPIIDLNNDTDVIKYKPDGTKITADVSSTAQVYLGGSPEDASYKWSCNPDGGATFTGENAQTITVTGLSSNKVILTCTATTTNFKDKNGKAVQISKDFVVSKEVVVASYWLSFSPVHTGNLQQTDIEVKALAKIGNDNESKDTNAYFRYSWNNGTTWIHKDWIKPTDATLIVKKADIQNNNLRIQATHDSEGDNRQVYEDETITYSPLNTPVLDLTNDSDAIAYDDNTILGNSVSSTAVVYLNGSVISGCTFAWTAANCTISGATDSDTVTVSAIDDNKSEGTATCRVTLIPNYRDTELVKVFTVAKQYKGNKGTDGPTPASSTTYYIYSADTPSLDDPKWKTDPANLDKPNGGYFCWTKTVTTYSNGKTITDGPNKDAAFALAQGKSTNYYSPTAPSVNIQEGDCWFKTISSTDDEYNNEMSDQDQGKLYQCSGFDADGKAIWKDVGGELVANKLTANYINALDITTKKIHVNDTNGNTLFKANGIPGEEDSNQVTIGGFKVAGTSLSATIDTSSTDVDTDVERSFNESTLTNTGITDITGEYTSLAPTTIYCHNAGDLIALTTDQESFNQIYKDTDLLKELETRPWLEFSVKASNSTSQYICIYNSTTLDNQGNQSPINDVWDIYIYNTTAKTWKKDTSSQLITNVITHYKAQVYVGTDKIEVTNGDKIVKLQNGNLFANSADISGTITATSGNIGGFKLQNKDLIAQQSSEDDIVPLVSWFGTPLADKRIWNATLPASENTFIVSETISGWEIKYIYYEYNEEAPTAFDADGVPTEEQIKNKLTLYLVLVINGQTTQEYKFKTTITDYSIWERKELNGVTTNQQFIATKIPVDISNSSLATTRVSPEELFIGYEKEASAGYDSDYWFTLTPEMLKDSSIDINSSDGSKLYADIFKKSTDSGNGTPWSNLKFSLKEENPSIVIKDSKLTLKLGHDMIISSHIHVPPTIGNPDIGIIKPGSGPQITPPLRPFSIANAGDSVTSDISLGKDENLGKGFGDIKTRTIYHYYNIARIDPGNDEIIWQSTSGPSIKTRYLFPYQLTINNTPTEVKIPLTVKVPKKDSYVKAEANGALIANNATISGNLNADAGKVGCFDIYETGLYSDFIELSKDSLVLTGGKFTLSSSNNGDSISLDTTSKSDPAIIFSGNGSIVDQTGSVGLRFKAGESKNQIEYKAVLYATGTDGWGGNNSITITTKAYDPSSKNWNTLALKKDRTFTIYHKGYDMGDKIRQLTITLKAGEYTKTVEFGGYWTFYGASWTSNGGFEKNTEVEGSTFTQTEVVPASLYALSSILPQSTGATSGTISVYYNTSYGSPVNDYEYGGTKEISGTNYYVWSGNHGATGHPTEYYTLTTTKPENIITGSNENSTTLYYIKDGKLQDNRDIKSSMYVQYKSITTTTGCSLGSDTAPWAAIWTKKVTGEVINLSSDLRLKQNINYDISKYDNLFDSLKPASYQFKSDLNSKTHLGFIAQEVEQSLFDNNLTRKDFAGVTIYGEGFDEKTDTILNLDKTTYALGYNELHALEVRQIQLLKARVQELEAKIEQLIKNKE